VGLQVVVGLFQPVHGEFLIEAGRWPMSGF
jgi:hypothetical protein